LNQSSSVFCLHCRRVRRNGHRDASAPRHRPRRHGGVAPEV